jgi:hypothetical protein
VISRFHKPLIRTQVAVLASALIAALSAVVMGATPEPYGPITPDKIFANARLAMYLRTYPRYLSYLIDIQSNALGKHYHEGYRVMLRTHDNDIIVKQTPVYTTNKPPNPYGWTFFGIDKTGKAPDHIEPPFGPPLMSATFDFGLSRPPHPPSLEELAIQALEGASPTPTPKVIGNIAVSGADYHVDLIDIEPLDGYNVYHLRLTPLFDPSQNRLRELWVDTQTFNVVKLVTEGIFETGPAANALWTVSFIDLHGYWLIRTETTDATLSTGGGMFGGGTTYHGVNYTFGAYAYPGYISELEFAEPPIHTDAIQE